MKEEPEQCCCYCKHHEARQELMQDRLDIDVRDYCLKIGDRIYTNIVVKNKCEFFELMDEIKEKGVE